MVVYIAENMEIMFNVIKIISTLSKEEYISMSIRHGRGVRGAVWFGFEVKSHPNRKIKKLGSVDS